MPKGLPPNTAIIAWLG